MEYVYLTEDDIVQFNEYVIKKYSPKEPIKLIDGNALNMLVNLPRQDVYGVEIYPNIQLKSAVLFRQIIKKHVFVNGNKRTAFMSLYTFLERNGISLCVEWNEGMNYTVEVDTKNLSDEEIAFWIDRNMEVLK